MRIGLWIVVASLTGIVLGGNRPSEAVCGCRGPLEAEALISRAEFGGIGEDLTDHGHRGRHPSAGAPDRSDAGQLDCRGRRHQL